MPEVAAPLINVDAHIESHQGSSSAVCAPLTFSGGLPTNQRWMLLALMCQGKQYRHGICNVAAYPTCGGRWWRGMLRARKYLGSSLAPVGPLSGAVGKYDGSMHSAFVQPLSIHNAKCASDVQRSCSRAVAL